MSELLKPGPELDRITCEAAGIPRQIVPNRGRRGNPLRGGALYPPVSTDLQAAWLVVEAMRGQGLGYRMTDLGQGDHWCAFFDGVTTYPSGGGETVAAAICRGALLALGQSIEVRVDTWEREGWAEMLMCEGRERPAEPRPRRRLPVSGRVRKSVARLFEQSL